MHSIATELFFFEYLNRKIPSRLGYFIIVFGISPFVFLKSLKLILKNDSAKIADSKDAAMHRDHFDALSLNIYDLIKVSKQETPTYYQFCPMANDGKGATWLSKENIVKNPYFGSMMLNCGKVTETIK